MRQRKFSAGALRAANGGGNGAGFLTQQIAVLNEQMRENRRLAQTEYEWLASGKKRWDILNSTNLTNAVTYGTSVFSIEKNFLSQR